MNTIKAYKVVRRGNKKYYSYSYSHPNLFHLPLSPLIVRYFTDGRWITPKKDGNQFLFACPTLEAAVFWLTGNRGTHTVFEVEIPADDFRSGFETWVGKDGHLGVNSLRTTLCSQMRLIKKIKL